MLKKATPRSYHLELCVVVGEDLLGYMETWLHQQFLGPAVGARGDVKEKNKPIFERTR